MMLIAPDGDFEARFIIAIVEVVLLHNFVNRFAIGNWRKRSRDRREGVVECLYGRVLHLPEKHLLVGPKKLGPVSEHQQQAFDHNAYYRVYIAPHSGDILTAEPAEKPKYDSW